MWLYKDIEFTSEMIENHVGFVYCITNMISGRKYIGKKIFHCKKYRMINKKRKSFKVESDWKEYYGSCEELKNDVVLLGKDNFKREILRLCDSKSEESYWESKLIFTLGCLESHDYYNSWVSCKIHKKNLTKHFTSLQK